MQLIYLKSLNTRKHYYLGTTLGTLNLQRKDCLFTISFKDSEMPQIFQKMLCISSNFVDILRYGRQSIHKTSRFSFQLDKKYIIMNKIFILPSAPNILKIYNKKILVTGGVSNKGNGFMNNMFHCPHISFARDLTKSGFW